MKKISICLIFSLLFSFITGCYGKFQLTRKVYEINSQVKDKFLRSATTWAFIIIPVYGVAALLDFVLFNTVEFWTGKNPIAMGEKEFFYANGQDIYKIKAKKDDGVIEYEISHFRSNRFQDQLKLFWDLKTGNSTGYFERGGIKETYYAFSEGDGVKVLKNGTLLATYMK